MVISCDKIVPKIIRCSYQVATHTLDSVIRVRHAAEAGLASAAAATHALETFVFVIAPILSEQIIAVLACGHLLVGDRTQRHTLFLPLPPSLLLLLASCCCELLRLSVVMATMLLLLVQLMTSGTHVAQVPVYAQ